MAITMKLKFKSGAPDEQLYNLAADPQQTKNVIREHREQAARMKTRLKALRL